jgi:hypothetical protein
MPGRGTIKKGPCAPFKPGLLSVCYFVSQPEKQTGWNRGYGAREGPMQHDLS